MRKKGSLALGIVAVVLSMVILGIYLVSIAQRECHSNRDCPADAYCSTEYECHPYPERILVRENNFLPAATVLGVSLVVSAYILKKKKGKEEKANREP